MSYASVEEKEPKNGQESEYEKLIGEKELIRHDKMSTFVRDGRTYYTSRRDAERVARRYDVIRYSEPMQAYYIRRPRRQRSYLERILGW